MSELADLFGHRFGTALEGPAELLGLARHRSIRRYRDQPVAPELVQALCATALSAPTKSDLQQADIVILRDPGLRAAVAAWFPQDPWIGTAPAFLVFCGNNRRIRQLAAWRGRPFANDHLDAFFNAAVDAGIVLATFVAAAERLGLGCCPISQVRDHAAALSGLLGLPDHVFPVAGLTLGWPAWEGVVSPRLPLSATVHVDRHRDLDAATVDAYDARRAAVQPYRTQRGTARFGEAPFYGWSEDKARQYAEPQRSDFGAFVRSKGFRLD